MNTQLQIYALKYLQRMKYFVHYALPCNTTVPLALPAAIDSGTLRYVSSFDPRGKRPRK